MFHHFYKHHKTRVKLFEGRLMNYAMNVAPNLTGRSLYILHLLISLDFYFMYYF